MLINQSKKVEEELQVHVMCGGNVKEQNSNEDKELLPSFQKSSL